MSIFFSDILSLLTSKASLTLLFLFTSLPFSSVWESLISDLVFVSSSILFDSGSTKFGDTSDDTHQFTGSADITGSFKLNGYEITEISNDTSLTDGSATAVPTENAVKTYINGVVGGAQTYLRKQFVKISTTLVNSSTASFTAVTASAPAGMTGTTEHDFLFFINGQYMEHDAITIQQASSTFYLKVD